MTEDEVCECGTPLDVHPPLPKPKPLTSWKAQRWIERVSSGITGRQWSESQIQSYQERRGAYDRPSTTDVLAARDDVA